MTPLASLPRVEVEAVAPMLPLHFFEGLLVGLFESIRVADFDRRAERLIVTDDYFHLLCQMDPEGDGRPGPAVGHAISSMLEGDRSFRQVGPRSDLGARFEAWIKRTELPSELEEESLLLVRVADRMSYWVAATPDAVSDEGAEIAPSLGVFLSAPDVVLASQEIEPGFKTKSLIEELSALGPMNPVGMGQGRDELEDAGALLLPAGEEDEEEDPPPEALTGSTGVED